MPLPERCWSAYRTDRYLQGLCNDGLDARHHPRPVRRHRQDRRRRHGEGVTSAKRRLGFSGADSVDSVVACAHFLLRKRVSRSIVLRVKEYQAQTPCNLVLEV